MGIRWGWGGACISLPHPSQSHSTFCETTRERDPQSRSGRHLRETLHHHLVPGPASLSALQCQALQVVGGHLEQPGLQPSQANSLSARSAGAQSHRETVWGQSTLPPHGNAEAQGSLPHGWGSQAGPGEAVQCRLTAEKPVCGGCWCAVCAG